MTNEGESETGLQPILEMGHGEGAARGAGDRPQTDAPLPVSRHEVSQTDHWLTTGGTFAVLTVYLALVLALVPSTTPGLQRWTVLLASVVGTAAAYYLARRPEKPNRRILIPTGLAVILPLGGFVMPTENNEGPEAALKVEAYRPVRVTTSSFIIPWDVSFDEFPFEEDYCSETTAAWAEKNGKPRESMTLIRVTNSSSSPGPISLPEVRVTNVTTSPAIDGFLFDSCGGGGMSGRAALSIRLPGEEKFLMTDAQGMEREFGYTLEPEEMAELEMTIESSGQSFSGDIEFSVSKNSQHGTRTIKGADGPFWTQLNPTSSLMVGPNPGNAEKPFLCRMDDTQEGQPCSLEEIRAAR